MLVIMESGASEPELQRVIDRMIALGLDVHRSSGMTYTVLGGIGSAIDIDLGEFRRMSGVREAIRLKGLRIKAEELGMRSLASSA